MRILIVTGYLTGIQFTHFRILNIVFISLKNSIFKKDLIISKNWRG